MFFCYASTPNIKHEIGTFRILSHDYLTGPAGDTACDRSGANADTLNWRMRFKLEE